MSSSTYPRGRAAVRLGASGSNARYQPVSASDVDTQGGPSASSSTPPAPAPAPAPASRAKVELDPHSAVFTPDEDAMELLAADTFRIAHPSQETVRLLTQQRNMMGLALVLFTLLVCIMAWLGVIAGRTNEDTEILRQQGLKLMQQMEAAHVMQTVHRTTDLVDLELPRLAVLMRQAQNVSSFITEVAASGADEDLPALLAETLARSRVWMDEISHMLNRTALHFSIGL